MRQVFSSPRLENVEGVAEMLREQGIEVYISSGRSYHGNRRRHFTYRDSGREDPDPALWIVKSEDQPRAREILREIGLITETTRPDFALANAVGSRRAPEPARPSIRPTRVLLFMALIVATLSTVLRSCG